MAAQAFESLSRAHTLALSARSVTLKLESGLKVKCGKKRLRNRGRKWGGEKEKGERERKKKRINYTAEYDQSI